MRKRQQQGEAVPPTAGTGCNMNASHKVETQWMGAMQFNALVQDHVIVMDAPGRAAGNDNGPIPKPLILTALTGCTGMDVVALLRKQGFSLQDFVLSADGELTKRAPLYYQRIHLTYSLQGDAEVMEPALAAIEKSQLELCGVSYMLRQATELTWSVTYNGVEVFNNQPAELATA